MHQIVATTPALNQQLAHARAGGLPGQYLTFMVGNDLFAVGVLAIKEIIEYGGVTEVPMMPSFVRGIINLRGAVVPVIDLQARFGRARTQAGRKTCIVIVEVDSDDPEQPHASVMGVVVDAVQAVLEIDAADIEPPPSFGASIQTELIAGMARLQGRMAGRFVTLLELERVVAVDEALAPPAPAPAPALAN
jgi:purine-binding chemotaxis protein CheW